MAKSNAVVVGGLIGWLCLACTAVAQDNQGATHQEHQPTGEHAEMMMGPLGIPLVRDASGTSWQPDESPMQAIQLMVGTWQVMLHGNAFLQYINERSPRTDDQFGSINFGGQCNGRCRMGAGRHALGDDTTNPADRNAFIIRRYRRCSRPKLGGAFDILAGDALSRHFCAECFQINAKFFSGASGYRADFHDLWGGCRGHWLRLQGSTNIFFDNASAASAAIHHRPVNV